MIKIYCHTNLDLINEIWPRELPALPQVGDLIQSHQRHQNGFQLQLEVVSVKWASSSVWEPHIELHVPKARNWNLTEFYEWYAPKVGKTVSYFI